MCTYRFTHSTVHMQYSPHRAKIIIIIKHTTGSLKELEITLERKEIMYQIQIHVTM